MKTSTKAIVAALVLAAAAGISLRVMQARSAPAKETANANASARASSQAEPVIELAASDVMALQIVQLVQGVPISGSLKAVNSALVKAKVAGELQQLSVREGDAVKAGQRLARIDSTEYAARARQAQETADAALAQISIAQRQFDNNKALVDQGFISKTALDSSLASLQVAQSNHKAALAGLDIAKKSASDTVLTAPISGIVSQRMAQPGERVGIDARIVEIVDVSRLELEAQMAASDSLQVRVGQMARLTIEGQNAEVTATVSRINPSASAGSRSVLVYLSMAASGNGGGGGGSGGGGGGSTGLRQGMFAQGSLETAQQSLLAVPLSAVRTDKPLPYLQLVQDGRIAHQTVSLGARGERDGQTYVALEKIALGAILTKASAGNLRENTRVKLLGAK